jgi:hypothetical protein
MCPIDRTLARSAGWEALTDGDLVLDRPGSLVERHHHHACAEAADDRRLQEVLFTFLEADHLTTGLPCTHFSRRERPIT